MPTIESINKRNLDQTPNHGQVDYIAAKGLVLIGDGHDPANIQQVEEAFDVMCRGTITVTKGKLTDPGELLVSGAKNRFEFETALAQISKKRVRYSD